MVELLKNLNFTSKYFTNISIVYHLLNQQNIFFFIFTSHNNQILIFLTEQLIYIFFFFRKTHEIPNITRQKEINKLWNSNF